MVSILKLLTLTSNNLCHNTVYKLHFSAATPNETYNTYMFLLVLCYCAMYQLLLLIIIINKTKLFYFYYCLRLMWLLSGPVIKRYRSLGTLGYGFVLALCSQVPTSILYSYKAQSPRYHTFRMRFYLAEMLFVGRLLSSF